MIKRLVSILLVVILLIPLTVFSDNLEVYGATNSDPNMYNDNAEFRNLDKQTILDLYGAGGTIGNYLGGMPATNANGLLVNVEMMLELGVIVYGSPSSVSTNEHVAMTQRTHPSTQGYFKGGVMNALGEYRYLGRDVSGHAFTNQAFVPDELNPNKDFASRTWVYQPWRTINWHPVFGGSQDPSPFHRVATEDIFSPQTRSLTTQWITKLVTDGRGDIGGGVIKNSTSQGNYNAVEHIHVSQNPTMRRTSKGVMFHETSSGAVFYQTLSDMPNMAQDVTPVITTVRVPTGQDLTFEKGATEVVFEVTVTGVLQDDDIVIDDSLQSIYYDRHDIQHWEFELTPSRGAVIEPIGSPVVNRRFSGIQTATQRFRVRVASTEAGVVTLEGLSRPVFFNNEFVQDTGLAVAHLIGGTEDFGSIFGVSDNIVVEKIGDLNKGHIGYRDMSFGDLTNYHLIITGSEVHNIHVPAPTESELPAFNNDIALRIRDFIYGEIGNETEGSFDFNIEQTVTQEGTGETRSFTQTITIVLDNYQPVIIEYEQLVQPDPQIPTKVFDLAPLNATDGTPAGIDNRVVKINGQVVDDNLFFSGNFVFGTDFSDTWAFVEVTYTQVLNYGDPETGDPEWRLRGDESVDMPFSLFVWVVDTKPKAQFETDGTFKENRLITIADDTTRANYAEVMAVYPIHSWEWLIRDLDGNNADLRIEGRPNGLVSQNHAWTGRNLVRLLSKQSGSYEVSLVVKNNVEGTIRTSDVFTQKFHVLPDEIPALITNIWASQILREDSIDMYYHGVSVDDDTIASSTVRLYHDHNNNGTVDHFIMQGTITELKALTHAELGTYKFTVELIEEFGQPTIPAFVTPEDRRRVTNEVKFWVENLRPLTEVYVDIPIHLPEIDLHIMTDQNMVARTGANVWNKAEVAHISSNLVTINNDLRLLNVRPTVTMRDLHTYVHEAPASTTTSGSSRRPSSIPYSKSGYSGTLTRFREDNIGYRVSGTRRERRTGTRTVSRTFSATHSNNVWGSKRVFDDGGTRHTGSGQSSPAPSSKFINSGGFSGSIPRGPTTGSSGSWRSVGSGSEGSRGYTDYYRSGTWTAHYRGSLSKQERYTYTVNVPYSYWVSRWRGHYSGTLYKSVKQSFTTVFTNEKASRYTIYVSKNTINNMAYVNQLLATADTNFILIGSPAIRSQLSHIKFFDIDSKPFEELLQDALNFISENNPYISQHTALAHIPTHREEMVAFTQDGTNFNVSHNDFEDEGDPIIEEQWKITQDQNHFATPLGFETALVLDTWFAGVAPTRFNTTGKFSIQRRVLDNPSLDSNFTEFNYLSNEPALEIFAHRRPVAMATLDAVHTGGGNYNITWADQSFDFDHVGRRTDRGIIEHVVRYSKNSGPWFYGIPASLLAGSYDLEYTVRDVENTWSDVFRVDFVLHSPPNPHTDPPPPVFTPESVEFETSLKTQNPTFGLNSIPASETLVIHDTWTRYADTVKIDVELLATAAPAVTFHHNASDTTDPNFPKDIWWRDLVYNIPATVPNGTYTLRVTAVDHLDRRTNRDFSVVVDTPINISINLPEVVIGGEDLIITATTSKYVNEGDFHAKLFEGMLEGTILPDGTILKTKLETEELEFLLLKEEDNKRHWEITYFVATDIPEKTYPDAYIANFRAYAINHTSAVSNFETQNVAFELQQLRLEDLRITSIYDAHWRDNFLERNNQPTNLKTEGIQIKDMPVYINDKHKWVRLGNIVELKIDSMGLNGEHDEIEINVRYHALDRMNKLHNVDVYVYDDEEEFVKIQNSQYNQIVYNLTLNAQNHRKPYETDPGDNNRNTWEFILYLPPETRVVKRGRELDLVNRNHFDHLLLVVIEITAKKANRLQYSYSINAEGWGEDTGSIYGKNKPTKLNLLGHGINRGEVFWFNLGQNILQDIEIERGW